MNFKYSPTISAQIDAMRHSFGALVGIAQSLLCEEVLSDNEVGYLKHWLDQNEQIPSAFPADVIYEEIISILAKGVVTADARTHFVKILQDLIGAPEGHLSARAHVIAVTYDEIEQIDFADRCFCLTGDFIHGSRQRCESAIEERGGFVSANLSQDVDYLIIGSLGSIDWKHGSFGAEIDRALDYKKTNCPILIVAEAAWRESLNR